MSDKTASSQFEVREQVHLSFVRLLEVCLESISYRLLRSIVTVFIVIIAIAFLASIMVEGYIGKSLRDTVWGRTSRGGAYTRFLKTVSVLKSKEEIVHWAAGIDHGTFDFKNLVSWGGFDESAAGAFITTSRTTSRYLTFFANIPAGRLALLVENNEGIEIFDWLGDSANFEGFAERFAPMKNLRLPGEGLKAFREFLDNTWPPYRAKLETVQEGYARTIGAIAGAGDDTLQGRLRSAVENENLEAYLLSLADLGYHVDPGQIEFIREGIRFQAERDWAVGQLKKAPVRTGWNRRFQEKFSVTEALESIADNPGRAEWVATMLEEEDLTEDYESARLVDIARRIRDWNDLVASEQVLVARYGGSEGFSRKTWWLIIVSATVCVVGIANAMLMSVLERFKEIATMKCLGARNSTIAFLFVMESIIIGAIGGLVGMIGGFLIVFLRQLIAYGSLLFAQFPVSDMLLTTLICFCCSLLLTAIAAIYPAHVAARMAPMEAMRID